MVEQDCALNGHKATEAFVGLEQSAVVDEDRGSQCCGLCRQFLLHGPQDVPCMSGGGPRGWGGPPPQALGWELVPASCPEHTLENLGCLFGVWC